MMTTKWNEYSESEGGQGSVAEAALNHAGNVVGGERSEDERAKSAARGAEQHIFGGHGLAPTTYSPTILLKALTKIFGL